MQSSLSRAFNAPDFVSVCLCGFSVTRTKKPAWLLGFHRLVSVCLYFLKLGKMNEYKSVNGWNGAGKNSIHRMPSADFARTPTQTIKTLGAARTLSVSVALGGTDTHAHGPQTRRPGRDLGTFDAALIDVTATKKTATQTSRGETDRLVAGGNN